MDDFMVNYTSIKLFKKNTQNKKQILMSKNIKLKRMIEFKTDLPDSQDKAKKFTGLYKFLSDF